MPFRARVRKALGGGSGSDETDDLGGTGLGIARKNKKEKIVYPDNVYKPGEPMPRPKYRGPYNKAHQERLGAFSFGNAWKQRTYSSGTAQSDYSPMGSKLPSRGPSRRGSGWSVGSPRRWGMGSRHNSHSGYDGHESGADMEEGNEEDEVTDGATTASPMSHYPAPSQQPSGLNQMQRLETQRTIPEQPPTTNLHTIPTTQDSLPFTAEALASAMSQSTLKASDER